MTENVTATTAIPGPPPASLPPRPAPDPDRFLLMAKRVVVDNYNTHRDESRSPELTMDAVYIVWFAKTMGNWKAVVSSPTARGLLWEVTYNGHRQDAYIEIYKKLNNVKVSLGDTA
jgi:hypothetical protein